jgi:hypothetical protein
MKKFLLFLLCLGNAVAIMSTTVVWPGGNLADLQQDRGLAEQRFRIRYRR